MFCHVSHSTHRWQYWECWQPPGGWKPGSTEIWLVNSCDEGLWLVTLCLLVSRLSAVRSSNMRSSRWTAREISIALYWVYSCNVIGQNQASDNTSGPITSVFSRAWGLLHHTQLPTPAPVIARPANMSSIKFFSTSLSISPFQIQRGANTDHHDQAITPSSLSV